MSLGNQLYRRLARDRAQSDRVEGAMVGVVTSNKDPEKLGRVQVKLPVISEEDNTWWAPVVSAGAGKNRGWFFIPEVGDEVVLMFDMGDINHPVVVGSLWNGKDLPPDKNGGGNERRVIKSRAGSRLIFDDKEGSIIIEDGGGKGRITFESKSNTITVEALSGDSCLQSPDGELSMVADKGVIKAGGKVKITSGTDFKFGGDANITIKGSSSLAISAPTVNINNGSAQSPAAPKAKPASVADPYGS